MTGEGFALTVQLIEEESPSISATVVSSRRWFPGRRREHDYCATSLTGVGIRVKALPNPSNVLRLAWLASAPGLRDPLVTPLVTPRIKVTTESRSLCGQRRNGARLKRVCCVMDAGWSGGAKCSWRSGGGWFATP